MNRITEKNLQAVVDRINRITESPITPYVRQDGKCIAQIGNYHLSGAYGGVSLHRMQNQGGGIQDVFGCGHVPKRELYDRLHAFIRGIESTKDFSNQTNNTLTA